jgi:hypothetical protein
MSALYYRYGTRLFRVEVREAGDTLEFGNPEVLFDDATRINIGGYSYRANPNGGLYLLRVDQAATTRELRVVEGWRDIR